MSINTVYVCVRAREHLCNDLQSRDSPSLVCADREFLRRISHHLSSVQHTTHKTRFMDCVCVKKVRLFPSVFVSAVEIKSFRMMFQWHTTEDRADNSE